MYGRRGSTNQTHNFGGSPVNRDPFQNIDNVHAPSIRVDQRAGGSRDQFGSFLVEILPDLVNSLG